MSSNISAPTDDVRPFIASASAIVLPSYREGLPRSLLEAAAMARPLIATDVPGCRDVVEDGVNGYLCAVRDSRSLADAMQRFACLPDGERAAMGCAARRTVEKHFREELVVRPISKCCRSGHEGLMISRCHGSQRRPPEREDIGHTWSETFTAAMIFSKICWRKSTPIFSTAL